MIEQEVDIVIWNTANKFNYHETRSCIKVWSSNKLLQNVVQFVTETCYLQKWNLFTTLN